MTVSFFKLQVAGDDFILVDLSKPAHGELLRAALKGEPDEQLSSLAISILDRRQGVGASALILIANGESLIANSASLIARVFLPDGSEGYTGEDAWLCAARWAFDSARTEAGKIRLSTRRGDRLLSAIDSRTFALELPTVQAKTECLRLIIDGKLTNAYRFERNGPFAVALLQSDSPPAKKLQGALSSAAPDSLSVLVLPRGRELLRFASKASTDRLTAATLALTASVIAGRAEREAVLEWHGKGRAVSWASLGAERSGLLIDRGRFWVEWRKDGSYLATGMAEYAFEGTFDL